MNEKSQRLGEVIEASTTGFTAQAYELYELPPLGSLVKTSEGDIELYGVVCQAMTEGLEPGRKPIARGKDEASEEAIFQSSPQLAKLLRSEFSALVVGHKQGDKAPVSAAAPGTYPQFRPCLYYRGDQDIQPGIRLSEHPGKCRTGNAVG